MSSLNPFSWLGRLNGQNGALCASSQPTSSGIESLNKEQLQRIIARCLGSSAALVSTSWNKAYRATRTKIALRQNEQLPERLFENFPEVRQVYLQEPEISQIRKICATSIPDDCLINIANVGQLDHATLKRTLQSTQIESRLIEQNPEGSLGDCSDALYALWAVLHTPSNLKYLSPELPDYWTIALVALRQDHKCCVFIPESLKLDLKFACAAVGTNSSLFFWLRAFHGMHREFAVAAVRASTTLFDKLPETFQVDREVYLALMNSWYVPDITEKFNALPDHLQADEVVVHATLKKLWGEKRSAFYRGLSNDFKERPQLAASAVRGDVALFEELPQSLKQSKEVVLEYIQKLRYKRLEIYKNLSTALQLDVQITLAVIKDLTCLEINEIFSKLQPKLLRDAKIIQALIPKMGMDAGKFLEKLPPNLQENRDVALALIKKSSTSIYRLFCQFPKQLKEDLNVVLATLAKLQDAWVECYRNLPQHLQQNIEIVELILKKGASRLLEILPFLPEAYKANRQIVERALQCTRKYTFSQHYIDCYCALPEELKIDTSILDAVVKGTAGSSSIGELYKAFPDSLKSDKTLINRLTEQSSDDLVSFYGLMPLELREDVDFALSILSRAKWSTSELFKCFPSKIAGDPRLIAKLIEKSKIYEMDEVLSAIPEESHKNCEIALLLVEKFPKKYKTLDSSLLSDPEFHLRAVRKNGLLLREISPSTERYAEIAKVASLQNAKAFSFIDSSLNEYLEIAKKLTDRDWSALQFVRSTKKRLGFLTCELEGYEALAERVVVRNWKAMQHVCKTTKGYARILRSALLQDGRALQFADEQFRAHPEIAKFAIDQDYRAFEFVPAKKSQMWGNQLSEVESYKGIAAHAMACNWRTLQFVPCDLIWFGELAQIAIEADWHALELVPEEAADYVELALKACSLDVNAFALVKGKHRENPEIAQCVVQRDWRFFGTLPEALRGNLSIACAALNCDGRAFNLATSDLKRNPAFARIALKRDWRNLEFVSKEIPENWDLALTALEQDARAWKFVADELKGNWVFKLTALFRIACALPQKILTSGWRFLRSLPARLLNSFGVKF